MVGYFLIPAHLCNYKDILTVVSVVLKPLDVTHCVLLLNLDC